MTSARVNSLENELNYAIKKYHPEVDILELSVKWDTRSVASNKNTLLITLNFQLIGEHFTPQTLNIVI